MKRLTFLLFAMVAGCSFPPAENAGPEKDAEPLAATADAPLAEAEITLDGRNLSLAADRILEQIIEGGALDKPDGSRRVVFIGPIRNRTRLDLDTELFVSRLKAGLIQSRKGVVTKVPPDADENEKGIRPELVLTGGVRQTRHAFGDGGIREEFSFDFELVDIQTQFVFWAGHEVIEKIVGKPATKDSANP